MAELEIGHETNDSGGAWTIVKDGRRVGELAYTTKDPLTIVLTHTEVGPELRGLGAGARLVETAVGWARANRRTIVAACPFAKATIDKRPDLQDVLAR
jgi:predicted GNAT family acetyltransferase